MRVYLAGPMTGLPDFNYPAFRAAAKRLRAAGYRVENPAENAKPVCDSWLGYMRKGITQLVQCDAIVLLPGWRNSKGVSIEFPIAQGLDFPFFEMPADGTDVPTPEAFRAAWFDSQSMQVLEQSMVAAWASDQPSGVSTGASYVLANVPAQWLAGGAAR